MASKMIELKDVEHLAGLARIAVSDDEKKILQHDLEEILGYVSQANQLIRVSDINKTVELGTPEAGELYNVMRDDAEPHESGVFTESILSQAPSRERNRVFVKKIL